MKRVILACAAMLALVATATAADLPGRYGRRGIPDYVPVYNWTGFYVGINGGYGSGDGRWDSVGRHDVSGGLIGGTAGYNWQAGQMVFGVEGDIDWTGIRGSTSTAGCVGGNCRTNNTWLSTVRGRLGYSFDRFLPYITGGLAIGDIRASHNAFTGGTVTNAGWTVGGGMEFVIAGNWTAKAEYLYVNLGNFNCGLSCGNAFNPDNVSFKTHIVRGGVNLRF